MFEDKAVLT